LRESLSGRSRPPRRHRPARGWHDPERIGDILAHVFLHDIHHRGQVHAMLSGTSVPPPQLDEFLLDYDVKLREKEVERLGLKI